MIKLVIFDLDDTLYPEVEFVMSGFREVSRVISQDFGFESEKVYKLLVNAFKKDRKFVFNRVLDCLGIDDKDYVNKLILVYRTHNPIIHLYEDAEKVLPCLKNRFILGLITDGFPITQKLKIKALDIEKFFDKIIYTWEKGENYSKPSIFPFRDMLNEFKVKPEEAVYVGDNIEKDFKGPKDLGMITIRIIRNGIYRDSTSPGEDFEPDYVISSLFEVENLLNKL